MPATNPIVTTDTEQFVVGDSDLRYFYNYPARCECGAIILCRSGNAEATVNLRRGRIEPNTILLMLPGSILMLTDVSDDFQVTYCAYSRDIFAEASFRIEPAFFRFLSENPICYPHGNENGIHIWFDIATYTYQDRENIFRNTIIKNRVQNILLEIYDKLQRFAERDRPAPGTTNRQAELFHRFLALVHDHCSEQRDVAFYADKLCISTRYLSTIVQNVSHSSAKELIDKSVILEIKMMLQSTDLSVQEIAYRLHFPDQSYLGRYFKKHTGVSPTGYRRKS